MRKASYVIFLALACLVITSPTISAGENSTPQTDASSSSDSPQKAKSASGASEDVSGANDQVHAWFTQYDGIRREAEMSVQEKLQVHSFFEKVGDEKKPHSEKSNELAKKMMGRYAEAAKKIHDLTELQPTAELQKGYEEFFTRSSHLFRDYLSTNKKGTEKKAVTKEEVQAKKEALTALDKKNKELDARLRSKYSVRSHKHN